MSDLDRDNDREEPTEITTYIADDPLLIDPVHGQVSQPYVQRKPRKWLPLFLFVATCASTFLVGSFGMALFSPETIIAVVQKRGLSPFLFDGLQYSVAVMSILLAHEMGHYLVARYHKVPASLPYFIPMPFSPLGTMGAVIVQGRGVADRKEMFDIAIAGPLAGLVLALPCAWYGMAEAKVATFDGARGTVVIFGDPLVMQWMKEYFHGQISANQDVVMTPILMAGWVGILVTALNLIPIGQLDGGHILYCLIGKHAHRVAMSLLIFAIAWMVYTGNLVYILLVILLVVFGPRHPPTADDTVPLGPVRVGMGWLTLAFIVIGFTPNPLYEKQPDAKPTAEKVARHIVESPHRGDKPLGSLNAAPHRPSSFGSRKASCGVHPVAPTTASRGVYPHGPSFVTIPNDHSAAGFAISSGLGSVEGNSLIRRLRNSTGEPSDSRQM